MANVDNVDEVSSFINRGKIEAEKDFLIGSLKEVLAVFKEINKIEINIKGSGTIKDASKAISEYAKELDKAERAEIDMAKQRENLAKATINEERATQEALKTQKLKTQSDNEVIKQITLEEQATQQLIKTKDLLNKTEGKKKTETVADDPTNANIPFTNNLAELEKERAALQQTGTAVSDYTLKQRQAEIAASEFYGSQTAGIEATKEQAAAVESISLKYDKYSGTIAQNLRVQTENEQTLRANRDTQKDVKTAIDETGVATEKQLQKLTQLKIEESELVETGKILNSTIRAQAKESISAEGSLDSFSAQLLVLQSTYSALTDAEKKEPFGTEIKSVIDVLDPKVKALDAELGKFGRNVGNYSGALNVLRQAYSDITSKIDQFTKAGKGESDAVKSMQREQAILNKLLNSQEAGFANTTQEIRENQKALLELEKAGLRDTETFKQLAKATGDLKNDIVDLSKRTKTLGSNTFVFDGLVQGAQSLAGAYGIAQAAQALFGEQNEELQKTLVKLQAVQTIITSFQQIDNALQKESALILLIRSAREKALLAIQTIKQFILKGSIKATQEQAAANVAEAGTQVVAATATRATTGALIGLRAALIATGIGAILILLASAAAAMDTFSEKTKEAAIDVDTFAASVDDLNEKLDDTTKNIKRNGELNAEYIKQRGGSEKELAANTAKFLGYENEEIKNNNQERLDGIKEVLRTNNIATTEGIAGLKKLSAFGKAEAAKGIGEDIATAVLSLGGAPKIVVDTEQVDKSIKSLSKANAIFDQNAIQNATDAKNLVENLTIIKKTITESNKDNEGKDNPYLKIVDKAIESGKQIQTNLKQQESNEFDITKAGEEAKTKEFEKGRDKRKKADEEAAKRRKDFENREYEAQTEIAKLAIEQRKADALETINDDKATFEAKLKAIEDYKKASEELITFEQNQTKGKNGKDKTPAELELAKQKAIVATAALNKESLRQTQELFAKDFDKRKKQYEDDYETYKKFADAKVKLEQDKVDNSTNTEILNTRNEYEKKIAKATGEERQRLQEELESKLTGVVAKGELARSLLREKELERTLALYKILGFDTSAIEAAITAEQIHQSELRMAQDDKEYQHKVDNEEKLKAKKKELGAAAVTLLKEFAEGIFDREKNEVQDRINLIDKETALKVAKVSTEVLSEQEKAAKIATIQALAASQKAALEARQRKVDQDRAKFERIAALASIAYSTGKAAMKAVEAFPLTGGEPWLALALALGAIQAATVLARPLPRFKDGKGAGNNYEGMAVVDDGGKIEPIWRENGTLEIAKGNASDRLTFIGRNDIVFPSIDAMLNAVLFPSLAPANNSNVINLTNSTDMSGVVEAVNGIEIHTQIITERGHDYRSKKIAEYNNWVNSLTAK